MDTPKKSSQFKKNQSENSIDELNNISQQYLKSKIFKQFEKIVNNDDSYGS